MKLLHRADNILNRITMYRLLVYGLSLLALLCIMLSFLGTLTTSGPGMLVSLVVVVVGCYVTNRLLAKVWQVPTNQESWVITALILFFIMPQATTAGRTGYLLIAAILAIASKYMLSRHASHLFNPAAFGAAVLGLSGWLAATWWIGSSLLWPFTVVFGLLVIRKIRRFSVVLLFTVISLLLTMIDTTVAHRSIGPALHLAALSSPLIFLGTIMLTEPSTMPGKRQQQLIFAMIVAVLYTQHWTVAGVYMSPELALIIGNVYVAVFCSKSRARLTLQQINKISDRVYDYVFTPDRRLAYQAGQYMEWTLPGVGQNNRGNRRTFTIASAPSEPEIHLGIKFYEPASSYKQVLKTLKPGATIYGGQVAGNFVLPKKAAADQPRKLAFFAGGVGITPFRSILQSIIDSKQRYDATLIYTVSDPAETMYREVFKQAESHGVTVIILPSNRLGLSQEDLGKYIPDCAKRLCYISGAPVMVQTTTALLRRSGVSRTHIITDTFSGY